VETSLHRQLKLFYADDDSLIEQKLGPFRIDVVRGDTLIEIQHGSLSAIRDKIRKLLADYPDHQVLVVKPLIARKRLMKLKRKNARKATSRMSPKRGCILDLFDHLVYFTQVFPHKRLAIEAPLVDIEEWRYPGHGRRRRHRDNDFQIKDQQLISVGEVHRFETAADLGRLLPEKLPRRFHTGHIAERLEIDRWVAQRMAYTLRHVGTIRQVGKQGNSFLYELPLAKRRRKSA
jgi:hypothetical protein